MALTPAQWVALNARAKAAKQAQTTRALNANKSAPSQTGAKAAAVAATALGGFGKAAGIPAEKITESLMNGATAAWNKISNAGQQMFSMVVGKLTSYLDPIRLLGASLNSQGSGAGVADKAFKLLANTVGGLFLPIFLGLAASLLLLSGQITSGVLPAISKLVEKGFPVMQNMVEKVATALTGLWEILKDIYNWAEKKFKVNLGGEENSKLNSAIFGPFRAIGSYLTSRGQEIEDRKPIVRNKDGTNAIAGSKEDKTNGNIGDKFKDAFRTAISSFKQSIGPPAQQTSLTELSKSIQLAALNVDPIEVQQQKTLQDILTAVEQGFAQVDKPKYMGGKA